MKCKNRKGEWINANDNQDKVLSLLYQTKLGRKILKILIKPWMSVCGGWLLNQSISKCAIQSFVRKNHIDLSVYEEKEYTSYNDFFTRKIKPEYRPLDFSESHVIAPCDSKLSVYEINKDAKILVKNTLYSMENLLHSERLAKFYEGGTLLLFRLTVDDYHHYCYIDEGRKSKNYRIPGVFHTVNPLANDEFPIYKENTREFSLLKSKNFGQILMIEVGALLVGKIVNLHEEKEVKRGEEKGYFEFGGSTVILCFKKREIEIDKDILENSLSGIETAVKLGEKIGVSLK